MVVSDQENLKNKVDLQQAVILCGGLGTRLRPFTNTHPKPMVDIDGRPFLFHLLRQLNSFGVNEFLLLTGYLGKQISDYFGTGEKWGWKIEYSHGPVEWDTGKRIWEAQDLIKNKFILLYSDNYASIDFNKLLATHHDNDSKLTLVLSKKANGNISINSENKILCYDKTRKASNLNYVELGYMIADKSYILSLFPHIEKSPDISFSEILQKAVQSQKIYGIISNRPYLSISDPERLEIARRYLQKKKILLIDRDGTLNEKAPRGEYITSVNNVKPISFSFDALNELAREGFRFIIISNQAGIARGMLSRETVEEINSYICQLLLTSGAEVIDALFCPHHWDEGCLCRKPSPGMFYECADHHFINLSDAIYVGDDPRDIQAAQNAGCASIFLGESEDLDGTLRDAPIGIYKDLRKAVERIKSFYDF